MTLPFVLLVDDEVQFVQTTARFFKKRNLAVISAFSGEKALEMLHHVANVDVVVLDLKLPGMDGMATLRELKRAYPLVEVIVLTGHATLDSAVEGLRLGAFDYLIKPCEMEELLTRIEEAAKKKRDHEEKIKEARVKAGLSQQVLKEQTTVTGEEDQH